MEENISFLVQEINEQYDKPENKGSLQSKKYSIFNFKLENLELTIDLLKHFNIKMLKCMLKC